jgi:phosphoglycolate phosphatase
MIKACIFDLDGTLADTIWDIAEACNRALTGMGFEARPPRKIQSYFGKGIAKVLERCLPEEDRSEEIAQRLAERMHRYYAEHLLDKTVLFPGIGETVTQLRALGVPLYVVTNKPHEQAVPIIHGLFGKNAFVKISGIGPDVPRKPDPKETLRCVHESGFQPEKVVMIGDSPGDMRTAKNAGIVAAGVAWGYFPPEVLMDAGADLILNAPQDIVDMIER